ncbi:MAG: tetratricopeptide repeat protein, partial [Bryobacteraceae bacterium]
QHDLGDLYRHGQEIPQDHGEAVKWSRKAAEQGLADAQYRLGLAYYNGEGVAQNYVQAHIWLDLAASVSAGDDLKKYSSARDEVAAKMTPQQIAEAQRLAREWKSKPSR